MPPVSYRARRSTAALIIGAVIVVSGLLTAISGGALLALFGAGNVLSSGSHVVSTPTTALVADMGTITNTTGFEFVTGTPTLHLSCRQLRWRTGLRRRRAGRRRRQVPVRCGDRPDQRLRPVTVPPRTVGQDGAHNVGAPGEQNFWVASAQSATGADLDWAIQDGHYQVVIMNADGTANVHTTASVGVSLPSSSGLWILVISIGGVFIVVGGILMAIGAGRPVKN